MRRSKRIFITIGITIGFLLSVTFSLMNCGGGGGGGDGDGGPPPSQFGAYNFTAANMTTAASIAANTTGFWPSFSQITFGMMEQLQTSPTPTASQPHDLGMCISGTGTFTWTDQDSDNTLSKDDAVALNFTDCDVGTPAEPEYLNGTVDLLFTTVLSGPTTTCAADVTISVTIQSTETLGFSGVLQVSVIIDGDNVTFNYTPGTQNGVITAKVNGTTAYELGCFNVNHKFNMLTPMPNNYLYMLEPTTVIKSSNKIMTLMPTGYMGFREGTPDEYADFFGSQLISLSVPECAALGVPNGVGDSDGNYIHWFAPTLYDDNITLELFDKNNTLMHTIPTTWTELY
jgi:hypothetical protein